MDRRTRLIITSIVVVILTIAVGFAIYEYGVSAGVALGGTGAAALAGEYVVRGRTVQENSDVIADATAEAERLKSVARAEDADTDPNVIKNKALSGEDLAAKVDRMT